MRTVLVPAWGLVSGGPDRVKKLKSRQGIDGGGRNARNYNHETGKDGDETLFI